MTDCGLTIMSASLDRLGGQSPLQSIVYDVYLMRWICEELISDYEEFEELTENSLTSHIVEVLHPIYVTLFERKDRRKVHKYLRLDMVGKLTHIIHVKCDEKEVIDLCYSLLLSISDDDFMRVQTIIEEANYLSILFAPIPKYHYVRAMSSFQNLMWKNEMIQQKFIQYGGIDQAIDYLKMDDDDHKFVGICILGIISGVGLAQIITLGGLELLVNVINHHPTDVPINQFGCKTLHWMMKADRDLDVKKRLYHLCCVPLFLRILQQYVGSDNQVLYEALDLVCSFLSDFEQGRVMFEACHGLEIICSVMEITQEMDVIIICRSIINWLTVSSKRRCLKILRKQGLPFLFEQCTTSLINIVSVVPDSFNETDIQWMVERISYNPDMLRLFNWILYKRPHSSQSHFIMTNGIEQIIQRLKDDHMTTDLYLICLDILYKLAIFTQSVKTTLFESGLVSLLLNKITCDNLVVINRSCYLLWNLFSLDDLLFRYLTEEILIVIRQAQKRFPRSRYVQLCLQVLMRETDQRVTMAIEQGVCTNLLCHSCEDTTCVGKNGYLCCVPQQMYHCVTCEGHQMLYKNQYCVTCFHRIHQGHQALITFLPSLCHGGDAVPP